MKKACCSESYYTFCQHLPTLITAMGHNKMSQKHVRFWTFLISVKNLHTFFFQVLLFTLVLTVCGVLREKSPETFSYTRSLVVLVHKVPLSF